MVFQTYRYFVYSQKDVLILMNFLFLAFVSLKIPYFRVQVQHQAKLQIWSSAVLCNFEEMGVYCKRTASCKWSRCVGINYV